MRVPGILCAFVVSVSGIWGAAAYPQEDTAALFEFSYATATVARDASLTYDRYLLSGGVAGIDEAVGAVNAGAEVAQFRVVLPDTDDAGAVPFIDLVAPPASAIPPGAQAIAAAYVPTPSTILAGYLDRAPLARKTADGTVAYELPLAGNGDTEILASVEIDEATTLLTEMRIGGDDPDALIVQYAYGADLAPSIVVTQFSTGDLEFARWTMVDVLTSTDKPATSAVAKPSVDTPPPTAVPHLSPSKGVAADVSFSDSLDTLPAIDLGSSSCDAPDGVCFDLAVVEACFDLGLGVSLNTLTSISMDGTAKVEYPVDGQPGFASVGFTPTSGSSSINYSFAYSAELCGSFTFPIVGTCNAGARLARGSFDAASGEDTFTSFILEDAMPRPVCTGDSIGASNFGVNPGLNLCDLELSLTGGLSINPNVNYCLTGTSINVTSEVGDPAQAKQVRTEGGTMLVPAQPGTNTFDATWSGMPSIEGTVAIAPSLGISAPILGDLTVPFPAFEPSIPDINIDPFTLSDSFEVDLQDTSGIGGGGCFGGNSDNAKSRTHADAGATALTLGCAALALFARRNRRP